MGWWGVTFCISSNCPLVQMNVFLSVARISLDSKTKGARDDRHHHHHNEYDEDDATHGCISCLLVLFPFLLQAASSTVSQQTHETAFSLRHIRAWKTSQIVHHTHTLCMGAVFISWNPFLSLFPAWCRTTMMMHGERRRIPSPYFSALVSREKI